MTVSILNSEMMFTYIIHECLKKSAGQHILKKVLNWRMLFTLNSYAFYNCCSWSQSIKCMLKFENVLLDQSKKKKKKCQRWYQCLICTAVSYLFLSKMFLMQPWKSETLSVSNFLVLRQCTVHDILINCIPSCILCVTVCCSIPQQNVFNATMEELDFERK